MFVCMYECPPKIFWTAGTEKILGYLKGQGTKTLKPKMKGDIIQILEWNIWNEMGKKSALYVNPFSLNLMLI